MRIDTHPLSGSVPNTMFEVKEEQGSFSNILHAGKYQETLNFLKGQAEAFDIPIDIPWADAKNRGAIGKRLEMLKQEPSYDRYPAPTIEQALEENRELKEQLEAKEAMEEVYKTVREEMFNSMRKIALILVNHLPEYLIHIEKRKSRKKEFKPRDKVNITIPAEISRVYHTEDPHDNKYHVRLLNGSTITGLQITDFS